MVRTGLLSVMIMADTASLIDPDPTGYGSAAVPRADLWFFSFLKFTSVTYWCPYRVIGSVVDPDPQDLYVFGLPDSGPDPSLFSTDPNPSINKQKN
jgi:hypothetical protein